MSAELILHSYMLVGGAAGRALLVLLEANGTLLLALGIFLLRQGYPDLVILISGVAEGFQGTF